MTDKRYKMGETSQSSKTELADNSEEREESNLNELLGPLTDEEPVLLSKLLELKLPLDYAMVDLYKNKARELATTKKLTASQKR